MDNRPKKSYPKYFEMRYAQGLMMKTIHNTKIIGIDHGYGNMKTANCCFPTGITAYDHEPLFTGDMLTYNGRYYLIGEGHKEFIAEKQLVGNQWNELVDGDTRLGMRYGVKEIPHFVLIAPDGRIQDVW